MQVTKTVSCTRKHTYKNTLIDLIIISLVGLVLTFIWFWNGRVIAYSDLGFFTYNSDVFLNIFRYVWFSYFSTGFANPQYMTLIPFQSLMAFLQHLGFSPLVKEAILFFSMLTLNGLSMYYLTSVSLDRKPKRMACMLSSLFFMLNPYMIFFIWERFTSYMWSAPVMVFALALYIKGLEEKKTFRYVFYTCALLTIFSGAFVSPPFLVVTWLVLFSYFVFHVLLNWKDRSEIVYAIKFSVGLIAVWIFLNSWWILPLGYFSQNLYQANVGFVNNLDLFKYLSNYYDLRSIFSLISGHSWWNPIYSSTAFILIGILIPISAFSALLFSRKNRFVIYFSGLALLGLFFGKGSQPPFGEISIWLLNNVPLYIVFRNPFDKIGIIVAMAYAFLFGIGVSSVYYYIKKQRYIQTKLSIRRNLWYKILKKKHKIAPLYVLSICFLILGVYAWPMWTGHVFSYEQDTPWKNIDRYVEVPSYYLDAENWLSEQKGDYRVLSLPVSPFCGIYYNWEHGYAGAEQSWVLFNKPTISSATLSGFVDELTTKILPNSINQYGTNKLWKTLALLNVKFIVVNHDINTTWIGTKSAQDFESALNYVKAPNETSVVPLTTTQIPCNSTEYWDQYGLGVNVVSVDATTVKEGRASLRINSTVQAGGSSGGVKYNLPETWDWSSNDFMQLWFRIASLKGVDKVFFEIRDTNENWRAWYFDATEVNENSWHRLVMQLKTSQWQSTIPPSLSSIDYIAMRLLSTSNQSIDADIWWIDDIEIKATPSGTTWIPCDSANYWNQFGVGSNIISTDTITFKEGFASLKVNSTISAGGWQGGIQYNLPGTWDWSSNDFMQLWFKINSLDGVDQIIFEIYDTNGNWCKWHLSAAEVTDNTWQKIAIPLHIPEFQSPTPISLSSIDYIAVRLLSKPETPIASDIWWIDDIRVVPGIALRQQYINKIRTFGKLAFYEIDSERFLPRIYATNQFIFAKNLNWMINEIENDSFTPGDTIVFLSSQLDVNAITKLNNIKSDFPYKPNITFQNIDPTEYRIEVTNASTPYFLVFSESYHKDWVAYFGEPNWIQTFSAERVLDEYHFIANGYANAWYINKTGSYTITLEFWPQKLFYIGSAISITTLILCALYISKNKIRTIYKRYIKKNKIKSAKPQTIHIQRIPQRLHKTLLRRHNQSPKTPKLQTNN